MKKVLLYIPILFLAACGGSSEAQNSEENKNRFLLNFVVVSTEFVNSSGMAWDTDGSGPDIVLELYQGSQITPVYSAPVNYNVQQRNMPLNYNVGDQNINLSGRSWRVVLYDQDDNDKQQMSTWTFNGTDIKEDNITLTDEGTANKLDIMTIARERTTPAE